MKRLRIAAPREIFLRGLAQVRLVFLRGLGRLRRLRRCIRLLGGPSFVAAGFDSSWNLWRVAAGGYGERRAEQKEAGTRGSHGCEQQVACHREARAARRPAPLNNLKTVGAAGC
jgi:hypothetical protein